MQRKKATVLAVALILIVTFIISLPFSVKADGEQQTYNEALAAFREDLSDPMHIDSVSSAYLYCLSTDTELLSFDASPEIPEIPADTVKLLTALTAYELIDDLSESVTITQKMIDDSPGTRYDYKRGDVVTYRDLLCTLLMRTANDSATALAYSLCGDMAAFAGKMNEKAKEIGLTDSFFTNATGFYDMRMRTTARDIFLLANEFYKNETLMSFVGQRYRYLDSGVMVFSNNFLVSEYYNTLKDKKDYRDSTVNGMIVGSSDYGDVIVRTAKYNGYEYICVVLGAKKRVEHLIYSYEVSGELIKWGAKNYSFIKLLNTNIPVTSVPVTNARESDSVPIVPVDNFSKYMLSDAYDSGLLAKEINITTKGLRAPIAEGTEVGEIIIYYNGEQIAKSRLVTACSISENTTSSMIQSVWASISSPGAIKSYVAVISCVTAYILINSVIRQRRKIKRDGKA